jgi:hypothetical protein
MSGKVIGGTEYSEAQVRRLKRHVCFLCERPLTEDRCGASYTGLADRCTPEIMAKKRAECLAAARVKA